MGDICSRIDEKKNLIIKNNIANKKENKKPIINEEQKEDNLKDYEIPIINDDDYKKVEKKIEEMTGFKPYGPSKISLNKNKEKIDGTYFQYNKGCILYVLINGGWLNEKYIPDSMKFYKNHNHKEDEINDINLLRKTMSIIDLAQLWMNIGGNCPYLEINLEELKKRLFLNLKEYFENKNTNLLKKISSMTWQNKDYFELIGKINVKYFPLREKLKNNPNPCIKNAIDENIIKKGDLIKYRRHFIIFDEVFEEDSKKKYSFHDSLSFFFKDKPTKEHNNCEYDKNF
jgi:hypothetical protein